jgi:hypothetical protein
VLNSYHILKEIDRSHLEALSALKDQLVARVQEALNGKRNGNGNGQIDPAKNELLSGKNGGSATTEEEIPSAAEDDDIPF